MIKSISKNASQRLLTVVALFVVLILAISSIFVYYEFYSDEKTEVEEPKISVIDNRVSPDISQGLHVEILRVRDRSLLNKMTVISNSWKNPPSFYWKVISDGKEDSSLGNVGLGSSGTYIMWDTMGLESRCNFKINDEQIESDVTIIIVEQVKTGLFGRKTKDVEKEKIDLVYNYRTGRWTGSDEFKDEDGYGHYRGEVYDVWFNLYQADYDHDGIPYWTEVNVLGTDPIVDDSKLDPDDDGVPTSWEWKWGYDPFTWNDHDNLDPDVDGIENIEEYKMVKWLSDPFQPDIYIETDGMQKKGLIDVEHIFFEEAQQMIIERFAQHGINVYIDDGWPDGPKNGGGEMVPFIEDFDDVTGGQILAFYEHNFADERKGIFRYVLIANKAGWCIPAKNNYYDTIAIGTNLKSYLNLKFAFTKRQIIVVQAKGVLHELGHSLGLKPEMFNGVDITTPIGVRYPNMPKEDYEKYLNKYYSVMNYKYIWGGPWGNARKLVDYSDGKNGAPYDQKDWEHIYLPTFQTDSTVYEEAIDETFEDSEVVIKNASFVSKNWAYKENLTQQYNKKSVPVYFDNIGFDIKVFEYNGTDSNQKGDIRVYARPQVYPCYAAWSLIVEGKLGDSKVIKFYSIQDKIDEVLDQIAENKKNNNDLKN